MNLKALVIDDSVLFRTVVADALRGIPEVEVVGTAANGHIALRKIEELKPDLITLDIEMPGMNGIEVLEELKKRSFDGGVIIVSSVSVEGGSYTIRALELGAFDFITKPSEGNVEENKGAVLNALAPRVKAFARKKEIRMILAGKPIQSSAPVKNTIQKIRTAEETAGNLNIDKRILLQKPEMLLIGVSTGGPAALAAFLPGLPKDLCVPVVIVQHMPAMFTKALAGSLEMKCALKVCEASNGEIIQPGTIYIAPGGKQMKFAAPVSGQKKLVITDDPPENNCKPSVDYLFRSAANQYPGKSCAVILTGMGSDGTVGLKMLKRHGCFVIAQDEQSCVVYGMPRSAVDAGVVDEIHPLDEIASRIIKFIQKGA